MTEAISPAPFAARPVFADGKAPDALRTIGEVASALGIRQHVLRYWEEQFPMLRPLKRSGGRRYYRPDDVALVERINRLVYSDGYTLRGARLALQGAAPDEHSVAVGGSAVEPPMSSPADVGARLAAIRMRLAGALD